MTYPRAVLVRGPTTRQKQKETHHTWRLKTQKLVYVTKELTRFLLFGSCPSMSTDKLLTKPPSGSSVASEKRNLKLGKGENG